MTSPPLSSEAIVEVALHIAHSSGLSAITMRAVAGRLDVTAMALYRHVGDRDRLIRLVVDRVGALVEIPEVGHAWEEAVRAWATAQRTVLRRHPGVAAWLMANGPAGPQAYRLLEALTSALASGGFEDEQVASGASLIMSWTFSRVAIEDAAQARRGTARAGRAHSFVDGLAAVDPRRHPTASRVGRMLFGLSMERIFDDGVEAIIGGLRREG